MTVFNLFIKLAGSPKLRFEDDRQTGSSHQQTKIYLPHLPLKQSSW